MKKNRATFKSMRRVLSYRDASIGVPDWAAQNYREQSMQRLIQTVVILQRLARRFLRKRNAATVIQRWWIRREYICIV